MLACVCTATANASGRQTCLSMTNVIYLITSDLNCSYVFIVASFARCPGRKLGSYTLYLCIERSSFNSIIFDTVISKH